MRESIELVIQKELPEAFLVDVLLTRGQQSSLEILLDTETGIRLDECVRISRALGIILEEEPSLDFPYNLVVSSPGLERPLSHEKQLARYIGKSVEIKYINGNKISGNLQKITPESYFLLLKPKKKNTPPVEEAILKEQVLAIYPEISFKESL